MCLIFNGRVALVSSLIAGAVAACVSETLCIGGRMEFDNPSDGEVRIGGVVFHTRHPGVFAMATCPTVFCIVLLFWQRVRSILIRMPTYVFMDKLCICQEDGDVKTKGILGIAGFLKSSQKLVVLWSPRFFSRLWCVYEVATWIHLGKDLCSSVQFMPVAKARGLLCMALVVEFVVVSLTATEWSSESMGVMHVVALALISTSFVVLVHTMRLVVRDMRSLYDQLQKFSIRNADCFCCANNHTHPRTGNRMVCDRKMVHKMIKAWFTMEWQLEQNGFRSSDERWPSGTSGHSTNGFGHRSRHLDLFDHYIRTDFARVVLDTAGADRIDYSHSLVVTAPVLWRLLDRLSVTSDLGNEPLLRYLVDQLVVAMALVPATMVIFLRVLVYFESTCKHPTRQVFDWIISFLLALVALVLFLVTYAALWYTRVEMDSVWPQAALSFVYCVLAIRIYSHWPASATQSFEALQTVLCKRRRWWCSPSKQTPPALEEDVEAEEESERGGSKPETPHADGDPSGGPQRGDVLWYSAPLDESGLELVECYTPGYAARGSRTNAAYWTSAMVTGSGSGTAPAFVDVGGTGHNGSRDLSSDLGPIAMVDPGLSGGASPLAGGLWDSAGEVVDRREVLPSSVSWCCDAGFAYSPSESAHGCRMCSACRASSRPERMVTSL